MLRTFQLFPNSHSCEIVLCKSFREEVFTLPNTKIRLYSEYIGGMPRGRIKTDFYVGRGDCVPFLFVQIMAGDFQGDINVRTNVLFAEELVETTLFQGFVHFRLDTGKDDVYTFLVAYLTKVGQVVDTC